MKAINPSSPSKETGQQTSPTRKGGVKTGGDAKKASCGGGDGRKSGGGVEARKSGIDGKKVVKVVEAHYSPKPSTSAAELDSRKSGKLQVRLKFV